MTIQDPNVLYQFLLQQQVAEAYLEDVVLTIEEQVKDALSRGNNRDATPDTGKTKFTDRQFEEFWANYSIKHQLSDIRSLETAGRPGSRTGSWSLHAVMPNASLNRTRSRGPLSSSVKRPLTA